MDRPSSDKTAAGPWGKNRSYAAFPAGSSRRGKKSTRNISNYSRHEKPLRSWLPSRTTGGDLVRLALERSHSARQAVDLLGELIERHGQSSPPGNCYPAGGDNGFLIADGAEAFAVETAGHHWVYQEIKEVRAVSNVCLIRQDWDRISQ